MAAHLNVSGKLNSFAAKVTTSMDFPKDIGAIITTGMPVIHPGISVIHMGMSVMHPV